jgi:hypothetical protein
MINCKNDLLAYRENIGAYDHNALEEIDPVSYKTIKNQNTFDISLYNQAKQYFADLCKQYNI